MAGENTIWAVMVIPDTTLEATGIFAVVSPETHLAVIDPEVVVATDSLEFFATIEPVTASAIAPEVTAEKDC